MESLQLRIILLLDHIKTKYIDARTSSIAPFYHVAHINRDRCPHFGVNNAAANISVHVTDGL